MKVSDSEIEHIRRLSVTSSINNLSASVLQSLTEESLARIVAGFLYFKSRQRPDKDFAAYLATRETWNTMAMGLNIMGAAVPAFIFDKGFRMLVIKVGMNQGFEIGLSTVKSKVSEINVKKEKA